MKRLVLMIAAAVVLCVFALPYKASASTCDSYFNICTGGAAGCGHQMASCTSHCPAGQAGESCLDDCSFADGLCYNNCYQARDDCDRYGFWIYSTPSSKGTARGGTPRDKNPK